MSRLPVDIKSRQYPRIPLKRDADLQVIRHRHKRCDWQPLRVSIRTASCEGVGLLVSAQPPEILALRDKIVLRMRAGNAPVEIPGHVVWSKPSYGTSDADTAIDIGIQHDLGLARATCRELYSSWIVAMIISLRDEVNTRDRA